MFKMSIALVGLLMLGIVSRNEMLVINSKQITVNGNTSFGKFSCSYLITDQCDTIFLNHKNIDHSLLDVKMPVSAFGCGNYLLNKDFQRSLRAKEHPIAEVSVLQLNRTSSNRYNGNLRLNVAGKVIFIKGVAFKELVINNSPALRSVIKLNTNDLSLQSSKRLNGLVTVDEELEVVVDLMR